jgi:hypothetical protein
MQEISPRDAESHQRVAVIAECVPVPFLDGYIPAVVVDGKPRVVIKPVVERLGLNWASQYTKISAARWGRIVLVTTQLPGDTQTRSLATITTKAFSLWLAGIQEGRVADHARDDVIRYQDEAGDRLDEYFFGNVGQPVPAQPAPLALNLDLTSLDEGTVAYLAQVGQALTVTSQALMAQKAITANQAKALDLAQSKADYVDAFVDGRQDVTSFRVYCNQIEVPERKFRQHLIDEGLIYRKPICREYKKATGVWETVHEYHPRSDHKKWFHLKDQPEVRRHHNGQVRTTLYVTPLGKVKILEWLKRHPLGGAA